ncbi:MAG: glycine cleavage system protein GcvH [Armatimonadota bacterium]|nr:MAG: glycine cleavage system protein GcvH [Armatimonadota bacterium]
MYPDDLVYTESHQWARIEGDIAIIGITDYAQDQMGDLVYVDLPEVGDEVNGGAPLGQVESVKAVSDVVSPVSGEVTAINEALVDEPETVNRDPYGDGWLVKVRMSDPTEAESLLDAAAYQAVLEKEQSS